MHDDKVAGVEQGEVKIVVATKYDETAAAGLLRGCMSDP